MRPSQTDNPAPQSHQGHALTVQGPEVGTSSPPFQPCASASSRLIQESWRVPFGNLPVMALPADLPSHQQVDRPGAWAPARLRDIRNPSSLETSTSSTSTPTIRGPNSDMIVSGYNHPVSNASTKSSARHSSRTPNSPRPEPTDLRTGNNRPDFFATEEAASRGSPIIHRPHLIDRPSSCCRSAPVTSDAAPWARTNKAIPGNHQDRPQRATYQNLTRQQAANRRGPVLHRRGSRQSTPRSKVSPPIAGPDQERGDASSAGALRPTKPGPSARTGRGRQHAQKAPPKHPPTEGRVLDHRRPRSANCDLADWTKALVPRPSDVEAIAELPGPSN